MCLLHVNQTEDYRLDGNLVSWIDMSDAKSEEGN